MDLSELADSPYIASLPYLAEGLVWTLLITVVGVLVGFGLGAIVGLARLAPNPLIRGVAAVYVEVIRGTPMLAQILFLYFGISDLLDVNIDRIVAAIIAIAVNAGAYIAEIVRGAVQSVDRGQWEAGRSLGLDATATMRFIIWPQAFRRMVPPLGNQFIISLKDTSLFSVIAVHEILYQAKLFYNPNFAHFETLTMACCCYLAITIPTSLALRRLEHRMAGT